MRGCGLGRLVFPIRMVQKISLASGIAFVIKQSTERKKRWRLYILPQYFANQTKPTRLMERYGLMAVVPTLTALLSLSLNELPFCFV